MSKVSTNADATIIKLKIGLKIALFSKSILTLLH